MLSLVWGAALALFVAITMLVSVRRAIRSQEVNAEMHGVGTERHGEIQCHSESGGSDDLRKGKGVE